MKKDQHWTSQTPYDFIGGLFMDTNLDDSNFDCFPKSSKDVGKGLKRILKKAKKNGKKVTLFAYDDGDPNNLNGPVFCDCFLKIWEALGKPSDGYELQIALDKIKVLDHLQKTGSKCTITENHTNTTYVISDEGVCCDVVCGG